MLMQHPPGYGGHGALYHPGSNKGHPGPNMGVINPSTPSPQINHAVPSEYRLYPGPMHAHQYGQHGALMGTFQNAIANWLKSGR